MPKFEELNNLLADYELSEIQFKGPLFTWDNSRDGRRNVKQRIDRALVNTAWLRTFPDSIVVHES